jgi:hypothetical protein
MTRGDGVSIIGVGQVHRGVTVFLLQQQAPGAKLSGRLVRNSSRRFIKEK